MALPEMSPEDRAKALESAKKARTKRATLLRKVSDGKLTVAEVLNMADKDECYERIKVSHLLKAVPGYGEVRSVKLMEDLGIAESRRLRGLGFKQRANLLAHFKEESEAAKKTGKKTTSTSAKKKAPAKKTTRKKK